MDVSEHREAIRQHVQSVARQVAAAEDSDHPGLQRALTQVDEG